MFIFFMIAGVCIYHTVSFNKERERILIEDIALAVQYELGLAAGVSDGYERELTLPQDLDGINYTIAKLGNELGFSSGSYNYYVVIPNMTGDVLKGRNLIIKEGGRITIGH